MGLKMGLKLFLYGLDSGSVFRSREWGESLGIFGNNIVGVSKVERVFFIILNFGFINGV